MNIRRIALFTFTGSVLSLTTAPLMAKQQETVLEEIRVLAHPLSEGGASQSITVLRGDELARQVQGSLGETLNNEAGIQSASFGAAVGRPVIHGLGGARVKTTEDRIDSLDVSVTSGDHAVTIEPFIANQVTVLKGASTLLYGSAAIGGVVDVETGRIAKTLPDGTGGRAEIRTADNGDATTAAFRLDTAIGDNWALHVDGYLSDADDYDIPGFAESARFRAAEEAEEDHDEHEGEEEHEHEEEEEAFGVLEGSRAERHGGAVGLSYIGERGFVGFSISSLDAEYGLVGGHGHEEGEEEEGEGEEEGVGIIDMAQTRYDIEAQLENPFAGFESLNFRLGINDYEHQEIEGNGEVGTDFNNDAWEARLQLRHSEWAGVSGSFGLQANGREFSALGEEAFVPPVDTDSVGVFWVGERDLGDMQLEGGLRFEDLTHKPTAAGLPDRDFSTFSASAGLIKELSGDLTLAALLDYSSRAPTIEELYSDGPHLATNSFEIGDPNLQEEKATGLTLSAGYVSEFIEIDVSAYYMDFSDFIYEQNADAVEDGLPVFVYRQADADFVGLDFKALVHLGVFSGGDLDLSVLYDSVRGELDQSFGDSANLPRIPASRTGLGLRWTTRNWSAEVNWLNVDGQERTAATELATDSYSDLSIYVDRKLALGDNEVTLFAQAKNLADDEQRYHSSIVKEFAPAQGRTFELGARLVF